jgi:electron transport complex protein RnfG
MKKLQSSLLNMVLVLTGVASIMGCILAYMNHLTASAIAEQEKKALAEGIQAVMGGQQVKVGEKPDTIIAMQDKQRHKTAYYSVFRVNDMKGKPLGVAIQDTVNGFGGQLVVLVGFDNNGTILGYRLLKQSETPGLGAKAETWFQKGSKGNIIGKRLSEDNLLTVTKKQPENALEVQAITASTITSRAFLSAINNAYSALTSKPEADGQSGASKREVK